MDDFEYCAQWYCDGDNSPNIVGWKGDLWESESDAGNTFEHFGYMSFKDRRIIKRRKAGPIEIVRVS